VPGDAVPAGVLCNFQRGGHAGRSAAVPRAGRLGSRSPVLFGVFCRHRRYCLRLKVPAKGAIGCASFAYSLAEGQPGAQQDAV
ncbi:hypothetical protein H4R99_008739, partial [Coemansia sp. RSA 1722]